MKKNVPSLKIVFIKTDDNSPKPKGLSDAKGLEDIFLGFDNDSSGSFSKEENIVLNLIDGARDVQEIIDLSKLGHFETCKILSNFYTNGVIKKVREQTSGKAKLNILNELRESLAPSLKYLNYTVIILILIYLAFYFRLTESLAVNYYAYKEGSGYLNEHIAKSRISSIRFAIETYYYENGAYPKNLNTLFEQKFLSKRDLSDPWGREYVYELISSKSYKLQSLGKDGLKGTLDDVS